jgi:predicted AAA+ superfamily ATPase
MYNQMLQWKKESNGKSALLIQGARRVGKSTLVEEFAKNEYKSYILIDFSKASPEVYALFDDMMNLDNFFIKLQFLFATSLHERESVIIFDEVQLQPKARQAIKHLVKDCRYDYIETGSLISIRKNVKDILIPSEERKVNMYPLDYEEFLWARGDKVTMNLLREAFKNKQKLGDAVHRKLMRDFRLYMLVGGMPQAVRELLESNDLSQVDRVKRSILSLYDEDFHKIDDTGQASQMLKAIPAQLSKNASRYQISTVLKNGKHNRVGGVLKLMEDSMVVHVAYHANDPNIGLGLTKDIEYYKMYLLDTGLFVTLAFMDKDFTDNIIYQKLLSDKLSANLGYVYENVVAQMLRANGKELYYHTMPAPNSNNYYEIDFLISDGHKLSPIEVKSSGYKRHASLDAFRDKYSERIQERYLIYPKEPAYQEGTTYLPVYMTPFV